MESVSFVRLIIASVTVLGLLAALSFALKYISARGWLPMGANGPTRRLKLVETLPLDARRRLVIVECDGAQHLLLLGSVQDIVVTSPLSSPSKDKKG